MLILNIFRIRVGLMQGTNRSTFDDHSDSVNIISSRNEGNKISFYTLQNATNNVSDLTYH